MPYPRWLAKINKRVINPRQIRKGTYPVVTHVGRTSGLSYRTPLDAFPTETGYVLVARYGPESDWVQNILAAGTATLRINDEEHELNTPRLVSRDQALSVLGAEEPPADFTKAEDFVLMDEPRPSYSQWRSAPRSR
ncbi:MAG: nitroreductase family deazaflavin-dependent oxidoreductase [Actinomycetia bacterium]|nr:nitroreductase family deazaflavin-dependent oxidoreductase [Actinomycetes bacterium]